MSFTAITKAMENLLNKESPIFRRFKVGTYLRSLAENVETHIKDQASHNFGGGHDDWVLTGAEVRAQTLSLTNANAAVNVIAPDIDGKRYAVRNYTDQNATIKVRDKAGVTIQSGKTAFVECVGGDYVRLTADV